MKTRVSLKYFVTGGSIDNPRQTGLFIIIWAFFVSAASKFSMKNFAVR